MASLPPAFFYHFLQGSKSNYTQNLCNLGYREEELETAVEVWHQVFQERCAELNKQLLLLTAECCCLCPMESQNNLYTLVREKTH